MPAVFSTGYGNVGSSIYYVLGIVDLVVMGAIPIALGTISDNQTKTNVEGMNRIQQLR